MTRKTISSLVGALIVMLIGATALMGQEPPEPPEPGLLFHVPEPPEPPLAQAFAFSDSGGRLGLQLSEVTAEKVRELKLPGEYGAVVQEVEEGSPSAKAGLAKNDVILEFAGERVRSVAQLQRLVRETPPGRTLALLVSRDGQTRTVNVKLEQGKGDFGLWSLHGPGGFHFRGRDFKFNLSARGGNLGISGDDLTKQLAEYFGVKQGKGVLVREVLVGSAAEKAGLKAGDAIVKVDSQEVGSLAELRSALPHNLEDKRKITLTIVRNHREQMLTVELEPSEHHPLIRHVELPEIRAEALRGLAAEYSGRAAELNQQMQKLRRELNEQSARWRQEWQRYQEQYRRQLKDEIERQRRLLLQSVGAKGLA